MTNRAHLDDFIRMRELDSESIRHRTNGIDVSFALRKFGPCYRTEYSLRWPIGSTRTSRLVISSMSTSRLLHLFGVRVGRTRHNQARACHSHLRTTEYPKTFRSSSLTISYRKISEDLCWGFEGKQTRYNNYQIALPERALLDWICFDPSGGATNAAGRDQISISRPQKVEGVSKSISTHCRESRQSTSTRSGRRCPNINTRFLPTDSQRDPSLGKAVSRRA